MEVTRTLTSGKTKVGEHVQLSYDITGDKDGNIVSVNGQVSYDGDSIGYMNVSKTKLFSLNISQESDITKEELTQTATSFINDAFDAFKSNASK